MLHPSRGGDGRESLPPATPEGRVAGGLSKEESLMAEITDRWFRLRTNEQGWIDQLFLPWMGSDGEEPVEIEETFTFAFLDQDTTFVSTGESVDESSAAGDILQNSPALDSLLQQRADRTGYRFPEHRTIHEGLGVFFDLKTIHLERTVSTHPVHPTPVLEFRATNVDSVPHEVNIYWSIGASNRYAVLAEKGDLDPGILDVLGHRSSVFFVRVPHVLREENRSPRWAYTNLNFGVLKPGETAPFQIMLW